MDFLPCVHVGRINTSVSTSCSTITVEVHCVICRIWLTMDLLGGPFVVVDGSIVFLIIEWR